MIRHPRSGDRPRIHTIELEEVDSTNNFLRQLGMPTQPGITVVTAKFQTAGRGSGRNRWESAWGENLLMSISVMPEALPARRMYAISEAAALAVADALSTFAPGFLVKWPNDVYFGDGKVAGLLIENDLQGSLVQRSVIGIGVNVNQRTWEGDAPNPLSLAMVAGHDIERSQVQEQLMAHFMHYMHLIDDGQLDELHATYLSRLYRKDEEHGYCDAQGQFRATLIDVEPTGHLILRDTTGQERRYEFKEVKFIIEDSGR